jgi:hypothetical protein
MDIKIEPLNGKAKTALADKPVFGQTATSTCSGRGKMPRA